jgi:hypothetical protein
VSVRDRLRRLDDNPISDYEAWVGTNLAAPIGTVGGFVMIVVGLVELSTGGRDTVGLLAMGSAWLFVGLVLLPRSFWRRVRRR